MNIYILGPRDKNLDIIYDTIIKTLKKEGHNIDIGWRKVSREEDIKNYHKTYKRNIKAIKKCDFMIVETSNPVGSVGFLIATALEHKKPVLAIYSKDYAKDISTTLKAKSNETKLLRYKEYSLKNLSRLITDYTKTVKRLLDTKFILIIPPEIDRYLEWASKEKRMHKAQLVREAIEKMMKRDKDWKEYLKKSEV